MARRMCAQQGGRKAGVAMVRGGTQGCEARKATSCNLPVRLLTRGHGRAGEALMQVQGQRQEGVVPVHQQQRHVPAALAGVWAGAGRPPA